MILSNDTGYYKDKYGIRIENLIYIEKKQKKLQFQNLTLAPIDIDMINFNMLNSYEKNYLFNYRLQVYSEISKFLNKSRKNGLLIN